MPGKTPSGQDNKPNGNGINGVRDVDMKEDNAAAKNGAKGKGASKGDMTVVVPPKKSSKAPESGVEAEGDVDMEDVEVVEEADPVAQAISSKSSFLKIPYTY